MQNQFGIMRRKPTSLTVLPVYKFSLPTGAEMHSILFPKGLVKNTKFSHVSAINANGGNWT